MDTKKIVKEGFYIKAGQEVCIRKENIEKSLKFDRTIPDRYEAKGETIVYVYDGDCADVALWMKNIGFNPVLLNMASNIAPGGGVENGAGAQEESLFRRSDYFLHLDKNMYPINGGIYSSSITFFKACEANQYELLDIPKEISVIAVPAIRHPMVDKVNNEFKLRPLHKQETINKIRLILDIAARFNHDCVVLSAFGCGAYKNPTNEIAEIFREVICEEFNGVFLRIVFAIFNDHNARHEFAPDGNVAPFAKEFGKEVIFELDRIN